MIDFRYFIRFEILEPDNDKELNIDRTILEGGLPILRLSAIKCEPDSESVCDKISCVSGMTPTKHLYLTYVLTRELKYEQTVEAFSTYIRGLALLANLSPAVELLECHLYNPVQPKK